MKLQENHNRIMKASEALLNCNNVCNIVEALEELGCRDKALQVYNTALKVLMENPEASEYEIGQELSKL